jgi:hypothetical protein
MSATSSATFAPSPWYQCRVPTSVAAGAIGAAVLATAAAIEVARAWTNAGTTAGAEVTHVVGGVVVAILAAAGFAVGTRARALSGAAVAAAFVLVAHGGTLVLEGQIVGALFLGISPLVALLSHGVHRAHDGRARIVRDRYDAGAMDEDQPPEDCTRCGACCFSDSARHARVTGDDHERLGEEAESLVEWIDNRAFMRLERVTDSLHKCAALAIDQVNGTFACSVYATRPDVCRDLERGSSACRGELATKSDRRKRALVVLRGVT